MHLAGKGFGRFLRGNANRISALNINECRCYLSPVAKFQSTLAETASGYDADGVGRTAVDLDDRNEPLAVLAVRIIDAKFFQSQHSETHTEDLPGAEVAVGLFGVAEVFVEGFHNLAVSSQPSGFSLTSTRRI